MSLNRRVTTPSGSVREGPLDALSAVTRPTIGVEPPPQHCSDRATARCPPSGDLRLWVPRRDVPTLSHERGTRMAADQVQGWRAAPRLLRGSLRTLVSGQCLGQAA